MKHNTAMLFAALVAIFTGSKKIKSPGNIKEKHPTHPALKGSRHSKRRR